MGTVAASRALAGDGAAAVLAPRPYALGLAHKHLPEMQRYGALDRVPLFMPVVGPWYKGLAVSVPLDLAAIRAATRGHQTAIDRAAIHAALAARYAGEPFVTVQPLALDEAVPGGFFDVQGCNGTNRADLFVLGNDDQCVLMARIDNLGKGASGAAVQAMNIHLGLDETLGLV